MIVEFSWGFGEGRGGMWRRSYQIVESGQIAIAAS